MLFKDCYSFLLLLILNIIIDITYVADSKYLITETKRILDEWNNKRGHDRCFSHNDILGKLLELYGMERNPQLDDLPIGELEQGCIVYRAMLHNEPVPQGLEHIAAKIRL